MLGVFFGERLELGVSMFPQPLSPKPRLSNGSFSKLGSLLGFGALYDKDAVLYTGP